VEPDLKACRNCHAPLRGEFCASCGQREGRGDLHFGEAVSDILGDVVTWDSRVWRTLFPLLFRPGFLSAEFNAGRRMRYMPPFRLYIVVSFLMFLVISLTAGDAVMVNDEGEEVRVPRIIVDPESLPADKRAKLEAANEKLAQLDPNAVLDPERDRFDISLMGGDEAPLWVRDLEERLELNAKQVEKDPRRYIDSLLEYLPQMMFVMLPLFALLLKLFYLFSPFHYLQHLVFALHYHTFVYLVFLVSTALEQLNAAVDGLFGLVLLIYLPLALRRTYQSSLLAATGKALLLLFSYGLALLVGMAAVMLAVLAAM
jgi:hypothetical protein